MKPIRFELDGHRSVQDVSFEAAPLTVLFGKNNVGKTNLLEAIHTLFAGESRGVRQALSGRDSNLTGGLWVELHNGEPFDESIAIAGQLDLSRPGPHWARLHRDGIQLGTPYGFPEMEEPETLDDALWEGIRSERIPGPTVHILFLDWAFEDVHDRFVKAIEAEATTEAQRTRGDWAWLEMCRQQEGTVVYRIPEQVQSAVQRLGNLASDLLPDFVEGRIHASLTTPVLWHRLPQVLLEFEERGAQQCADLIELAGSGAARWMAASVQLAIHLLEDNSRLGSSNQLEGGGLSGHVLLLDEPEAHLHPSAVASVVRWCRRMVRYGASVIVASHHEQFLRVAGPDIALVHVSRPDVLNTQTRTLSLRLNPY